MSTKSIEKVLSELLPTYNDDLPPELVDLSTTLLTQSRSHASSLKPEEEITRPYVCAEIACNRLATTLNLPPLHSRPPCPPRAYKKLYAYLEQSLAKSSTRPKRRAATAASTPAKTQPKTSTPASTVPAKRAKPGVSGNPAVGTSQNSIKDAPAWVMPLIRRICKTISAQTSTSTARSRPAISKTFPPHMFAGISSILSFVSSTDISEKRAENKDLDELLAPFDEGKADQCEEQIKTLVVAVYFVVLARRMNYIIGKNGVKPSPSVPSRRIDAKTYNEMCDTALSSAGLSSDQKHLKQEVGVWTANIVKCGWATGMEWFENIPLPDDTEAGDLDAAGNTKLGENDDEDEDSGPLGPNRRRRLNVVASGDNVRGLHPGLGTMMQDRVDWLSEDRKEDFIEWKEEIMERINGMEQSGKGATAVH